MTLIGAFRVRAVAIALLVTSTLVYGQAQEKVLYSFGNNSEDGIQPNGGLLFDKTGNIYGTTVGGGQGSGGTVFQLSPQNDGTWIETILYNFCQLQGCLDGEDPRAGLIEDSSGNLYGTTVGAGSHEGGVVFELSPPSLPGGVWTETVLWNFGGPLDGAGPSSRLTVDSEGNLYGTAGGGTQGQGVVFELTPNGSGGWNESILYNFCSLGPPQCADGAAPGAGVTFDKLGNLYGTTFAGGFFNYGVLYQLSPPNQGGSWTETVLYKFLPEGGGNPISEVNLDPLGNAYVTAVDGKGPAACGAVMKFVPQPGGGGTKYEFPFGLGQLACNPYAGVSIDAKGRAIYGSATVGGKYDYGSIYKIVGHTGTSVYDFCQLANCADGREPSGSLTSDGHGNLYSTTVLGGQNDRGVVFELTP